MDSSSLTPIMFVAQTFEAGCLTSRFLSSKTLNAKKFDFGDLVTFDNKTFDSRFGVSDAHCKSTFLLLTFFENYNF